jgi:hypothetical protein
MKNISTIKDDNLIKLINFYLIKYEKNEEVVATSQPLHKYTSNLKRNKKISDKLREIVNNKYTFILLEENFKYSKKTEVNEKLNYYREHQLNRTKTIDKELNDFLYNSCIKNENEVLNLLNEICCNCKFIKSRNRYSKYDIYEITTKSIIEVKNNTYSIMTYPNAVINQEKLNPNLTNLIIIYGYIENIYRENKFQQVNNYYFIKYNEEQFKSYNRRYIINRTTGRSSLVVDIPVGHLTPLNELELQNNDDITDDDFLQDLFNFNFDLTQQTINSL